MDTCTPTTPGPTSYSHRQHSFDSPQVVGNILDAIYPLAQSTAIKGPMGSGGDATYTVIQARRASLQPSPTLFRSASSKSASLALLDLDSLPSNLISSGNTTPKQNALTPLSSTRQTVQEPEESEHEVDVHLNADELRDLEDAFSDLATEEGKNTEAIATSLKTPNAVVEVTGSHEDATNASSIPSLSSDDQPDNGPKSSSPKPAPAIEEVDTENQENQAPKSSAPTSSTPQQFLASESEYQGHPLSTILEWRSRESFTRTSAYQQWANGFDTTGDENLSEIPEKSRSSMASKLPVLAVRHSMPGPRKSSNFLSPLRNKSHDSSSLPPRKPLSMLQAPRQDDSHMSSIFDGYENSGPQLLSPLQEGKKHDSKIADSSSLLRLPPLDFSSLNFNSDEESELVKPKPAPRRRQPVAIPSLPEVPEHPLVPQLDLSTVQTESAEPTPSLIIGGDEQPITAKSDDLGAMLPMETGTRSQEFGGEVPTFPLSDDFGLLSRLTRPSDPATRSQFTGGETSSFPISEDYGMLAAEMATDKEITPMKSEIVDVAELEHDDKMPSLCLNQVKEVEGEDSGSPTPVQTNPVGGSSEGTKEGTLSASFGSVEKTGEEKASPVFTKASCEVEVATNDDTEAVVVDVTGAKSSTSPESVMKSSDAPQQDERVGSRERSSKHLLLATSRSLFWRAASYGQESRQQFILRQDSDRLIRVKLQVTAGVEVFTLLDHRGHPSMNGTRLIDLPPRLACTVTVVYKPRPPLFWHTGSLSFRVLPTRKHGDAFHGPRNYSQRLIGYVTGSSIQCSLCRCVDETTYWTSAFPDRDSVDQSLPSGRTYYARVMLTNFGLRAAWILAVARRPHFEDDENSGDGSPLEGVSIKPERFVLRPSQSQNVTISVIGEPRGVQLLFYNGDEVIRSQCRKSFAASGKEIESPSLSQPRLHRRLRSAYVLRPFEGEVEDMQGELPNSVPHHLFNWHAALQEEQRKRQPVTLTVYPLLSESADASFEASCSTTDDDNDDAVADNELGEGKQHLLHDGSTEFGGSFGPMSTLATTSKGLWTSQENGSVSARLASLSATNASLITPPFQRHRQYQRRASVSSWVRSEAQRTPFSPQGTVSPHLNPPTIQLLPDSQLIFAPCRPGLYTSAVIAIKLHPAEANSATSINTSSTTHSSRLLNAWRLHWTVYPVNEDAVQNVFSCLIGALNENSENAMERSDSLLVKETGGEHHLLFSFRPPQWPHCKSRYSQEWKFVFRLTPERFNTPASGDFAAQEFRLLFSGEVIAPTPRRSEPIVPSVNRPLLRIRGNPSLFDKSTLERQIDLVNLSRDNHLVIRLGQLNSPYFKLIKPVFSKFAINPRSSVRLVIQFQPKAPGQRSLDIETVKETLAVWWSVAGNETVRNQMEIVLNGIL